LNVRRRKRKQEGKIELSIAGQENKERNIKNNESQYKNPSSELDKFRT
jgi:hypothetical protein